MLKKICVVAGVLGALLSAPPAKAAEPTGFWTADAPVVVARAGNEAGVALSDGRALVMGGVGYNQAEASAEIYEPSTASWHAVAPMHVARWLPQAATLPGNRVLVLGIGDYQAAGSGTYEIFDVTTGAWSAAKAGPTTSWNGHMAGLTDGSAMYLDPAQSARYSAATDEWTTIETPWGPSVTYIAFAVQLKSNELLVVAQGSPSTSYIYNPATDAWRTTEQPPIHRDGYTSAALLGDGRVVAMSTDYSANTSSGYIFDPTSESWSTLAVPFADLQNTTLGTTPGGAVIAVGGAKLEPQPDCVGCYSGFYTKGTWTFDAQSSEWTRQMDLNHVRSQSLVLTLPSGALTVLGYSHYPNISSSELFVDSVRASVADAQLTEGGPGGRLMTFNVSSSTPAPFDLHLRLDTVNGTAASPSDFEAGPIDFTIPAGATTAEVGVNIVGDAVPEPDESFTVRMSGARVTVEDGEASGTIVNDDLGLCATVSPVQPVCVGVQGPTP